MPKEPNLMQKICDWVSKYLLYAAIFLTPLFFLPWTSEILDFNKQTVIIFLLAISLFAWMMKVLFAGKFQINIIKINIALAAFFLVYIFATIFSVNRYGSFWGWPQSTADSLLSVISFFLIYFLVSNTFSKKEIWNSAILLSISAMVAQIFGIIQLLGAYILPLDFAKAVTFNTIGSVGSLGFFSAITIPLSIVLLILAKKWWKVLFACQIIFASVAIFLINFSVVWWALIAGCGALVVVGVIKRDFFDGRWMALPMFFVAVSLFLVFLNLQIPGLTQRTSEIFLTQKSSLNISLQAVKQNPLFGTGPGTFVYDFSKFKEPDFNKTSLWSVTFNQASSKFLTDLAVIGLLGILAIIAFFGTAIYFGVKFLFAPKPGRGELAEVKEQSRISRVMSLGILSALLAQVVAYFLYNSNFSLNFLLFFLVACIANIISENKKQFELKSASVVTLTTTFIFTLVFIFCLGILILDTQRYIAEIKYSNGIALLQQKDLDNGVKAIESAASSNSSSDLYFRQLSQLYLIQAQQGIQSAKTGVSDDLKNKVQGLVKQAVNAAKISTDLNPNSATDWASRGYIYQNLYGMFTDADKWAITSYDNALKLDPNDPYILMQEGSVDLLSSSVATGDQKTQLLTLAQTKLEKATNLNPYYSDALYSLGLTYDALGFKDKAVATFTKLQQLNPNDKTIAQILANLNAGLPALKSSVPPSSATTSPK